MSAWVQTWSGRRVYPLAMTPADLHIGDIAHSLSHLCRFNGHCEPFYSVAEHCMFVAKHVCRENALWALLHDAAEAYICDLPSPIKAMFPDYALVEENILHCVAEKWGLSWPMPDEVHEIDLRALMTEARDLMAPPPEPWSIDAEPLPSRLPLGWAVADVKRLYLQLFYDYRNRQLAEQQCARDLDALMERIPTLAEVREGMGE